MNIQCLPPRMAQSYADMATRGEFDDRIGFDCYSFFRGNNKITLLSINPPIGHVEKLTTNQMAAEREQAKSRAEKLEGK
jgi:hypothetical protein